MASITSLGVASGLDLEAIVNASINAENVPKMEAFIARDEAIQVELSGVGAIKSALKQFQETLEKLADIDNFNNRTASIKQPASGDAISVTTTSGSTAGNFNVEVTQLAQGSRAVSDAGSSYSSSTDVVTASGGQLTFTAGSKSFDVTLDAGATLEDLRTAINDASTNFGVTANIVNTGSESKLVLTSNETGAGNDLAITNNTAELDKVSTVANGGGAGGMAIATEDKATDAIIKVDGLEITNSSNTFKDAVQDMTIKALALTEAGESAKLTIDYDKTAVNELIDKFVADYNNLVGTIGFQTRPEQGLAGDGTMRSLQSQLINTLSTELTDAGPFGSIFDIGLGVDKKGYLEKSTLVRSVNEALDENFDDVGMAFAGPNGVAKKFEEMLANYLDSDGIIKQREDDLNAQTDKLETDVENHQYRMEQLEARLRKQYSSLDILLAEMQSTQSYLSAQLASLPGFTKPKS
ncbi:flagellar filament capping protein FliD [Pseudoalteromonas spongiae]|uniref:Flagellar hook-associated protein 2 n=1 Tax=Pseudoalteromonas spongiae TaxID=298657 RepID=A0ABU8EPG5_9GAMM